jgi:spermidine synthase
MTNFRSLSVAGFGLASLLSAALLFAVQPMVAKAALPLHGGSFAVWGTTMLFFQATLLIGYLYAHWLTRLLRPYGQRVAHLALLAVAWLTMPPTLAGATVAAGNPAVQLLASLLLAVGLPAVALSATAPLMQHWFARGPHTGSMSPYPLYAASNAGSLLALLSYPFLVEPYSGLSYQAGVWTALFAGFSVLVATAGIISLPDRGAPDTREPSGAAAPATLQERLSWLTLSLVPVCLLLATTQALTIAVAPVPLVWVLPFALYLVTFILAFASIPLLRGTIGAYLSLAAAMLPFLVLVRGLLGPTPLVLLFLSTWLIFALHRELATRRPHPSRLTGYYLWIATGGVCAGILHVFMLPRLLFSTTELLLVLSVAAVMAAPTLVARGAIVTLTLFIALSQLLDPNQALHTVRSPYGEHIIRERDDGRVLAHGNTSHGLQWRAADRRNEPTWYYHRNSPAGLAWATLPEKAGRRVAAVGLGAGTMAAYAEPADEWTFFEIDPAVVAIATDTTFFHYLADNTPDAEIVLGDARIRLQEREGQHWDVIILDAFTSDAVPTHLLTVEALRMYSERLAPGGLILVHISNRYMALDPVIAATAVAARLHGVVATVVGDESDLGTSASTWAVLARDSADLAAFDAAPWNPLGSADQRFLWTDERNSIVPLLMRRERR